MLLGVVDTVCVGRLRHDEDVIPLRVLDHLGHEHGRHDQHTCLLAGCVLEPMSARTTAFADHDLASFELAAAFERVQRWSPCEHDDHLLVGEMHMQISPPGSRFQLVQGCA